MPLTLTVSCFSKIQIGFAFLIPVVLDKGPLNARVCVCVCVCVMIDWLIKHGICSQINCICQRYVQQYMQP